jgi:hypothetical protein
LCSFYNFYFIIHFLFANSSCPSLSLLFSDFFRPLFYYYVFNVFNEIKDIKADKWANIVMIFTVFSILLTQLPST